MTDELLTICINRDRQGVPPPDAFLEDLLAEDEQEQSVAGNQNISTPAADPATATA